MNNARAFLADLTAERLRSLFDYNPLTGKFYSGTGRNFGREAKSLQANGYLRIHVDGSSYLAHRLAWLYVHGCWPSAYIKHADGNRQNNAIANLKEAPERSGPSKRFLIPDGELTVENLKKILRYDPITGHFYSLKERPKRGRRSNIETHGFIDRKGYVRIGTGKKSYFAHRLAWFYVHGVWPKNQIDHINRIKTDNRIENLRDVTPAENTRAYRASIAREEAQAV